MNDTTCFCGGIYLPATISLTLDGVPIAVPGYRCDECGETVLDAHVSRAITPELVSRLRNMVKSYTVMSPTATTTSVGASCSGVRSQIRSYGTGMANRVRHQENYASYDIAISHRSADGHAALR